MRELYVLRHGIAVEPGTPGLPDDERPLTAKGEKRMREIARGLRRLDLKLDRIVTSPLPRARSTAEIVADAIEADDLLETADILRAGTDAAAIQAWLKGRTEDRLMIVGHNPTLSDLITLLVLGSSQSGPPVCDLKKGGIAALAVAPGTPDRYELEWAAPPRLIRRLASGGNH
jgi:phosphohistidine phosphatase